MKVLPREPDPPCYEYRWVPEEGLVCMLDCCFTWALPHLPHRPLGQSFSRGKPFKRRVYRTTSMSRIEFIPQSPTPELGSCKYDYPSIFWCRLWFLAFLGTQEVCLNSSHQALSYTLLQAALNTLKRFDYFATLLQPAGNRTLNKHGIIHSSIKEVFSWMSAI